MDIKTFHYNDAQGWSVQQFPELDSDQTLVLILASHEFIHKPAPLFER